MSVSDTASLEKTNGISVFESQREYLRYARQNIEALEFFDTEFQTFNRGVGVKEKRELEVINKNYNQLTEIKKLLDRLDIAHGVRGSDKILITCDKAVFRSKNLHDESLSEVVFVEKKKFGGNPYQTLNESNAEFRRGERKTFTPPPVEEIPKVKRIPLIKTTETPIVIQTPILMDEEPMEEVTPEVKLEEVTPVVIVAEEEEFEEYTNLEEEIEFLETVSLDKGFKPRGVKIKSLTALRVSGVFEYRCYNKYLKKFVIFLMDWCGYTDKNVIIHPIQKGSEVTVVTLYLYFRPGGLV